jgi:hypothetical protein
MNKKGNVMAELCDKNWLRNFVPIYGTSHNVNNLNTKLQGQQKLISDICLGLSELLILS